MDARTTTLRAVSMFDTLKSFFFSLKWHFWRIVDDFSMVGLLALFGFVIFLGAEAAMTANPLGLIPIFAVLAVAMYWANKRENNSGKIQRLNETQITTERQEKAINEYVELIKKKKHG